MKMFFETFLIADDQLPLSVFWKNVLVVWLIDALNLQLKVGVFTPNVSTFIFDEEPESAH